MRTDLLPCPLSGGSGDFGGRLARFQFCPVPARRPGNIVALANLREAAI